MRKNIFYSILLTILLFNLSVESFALSEPVWQKVWSSQQISLEDITYGNGVYIALGSLGTILSSTDGIKWINEDDITANDLKAIAFGGNRFVAVGSKGTILTSTDGTSWSKSLFTEDVDLRSVTYGKGLFVATSASGIIITSSNGTDWVTTFKNSTLWLNSIIFDKNRFVAVGGSSQVAYKGGTVYYSDNGSKWISSIFPEKENTEFENVCSDGKAFYTLAYCNGTNGIIKKSEDGIQWETVYSKGYKIKKVSLFGSKLVVFSEQSDKALVSKDSISFSILSDKELSTCNKIISNGNTFIAIGTNKIINYINKSKEIAVIVNGNKVDFDVSPIIIEGRTLVPVRAIFQSLGANVGWYNNTKTVVATFGEMEVFLKINSKEAKVNKNVKLMDVPAMIINGRTLVPVRFISEGLGFKVNWDFDSMTITITR